MSYKKRGKRQNSGRFPTILVLFFVVLVVFEGKLLINIFRNGTFSEQITSQVDDLLATHLPETETETSTEKATKTNVTVISETEGTQQSLPISPAIVPAQETAVDDSFFSDAVFIGDSRMEGFRNASGLTQGAFLVGVGMNLSNIFDEQFIFMYNEDITVFQALYNTDYKKVYLQLGTNNLGEYPFSAIKDKYQSILRAVRKELPNAQIYALSIIYVEESKVTTGDYINNANIDAANQYLLEICEEDDYNYIDLNEALSDGNGSLNPNASSDGIHMTKEYYEIWLNYLKTHYIKE